MRNLARTALLIGVCLLAATEMVSAQEDKKGCKDHPLFSRMQGFYIARCEEKAFDAEEFRDPETKNKVTVEGRKYVIEYGMRKGVGDQYSRLQISRNYVNAIQKIGGVAFENDPKSPDSTYMKITKDGKEIWAGFYQRYAGLAGRLVIVEKQAMQQEIVADAKFMSEGITAAGHVAIYGIYFDFNKADVKPESAPALQEITKLLERDSKLKLYVVGHTDNSGGYDYNMKLSQARAEAVVKELITKHKVAAARLKAAGVGPLAPVTSNDTEEGKAKNRRVELVKQ